MAKRSSFRKKKSPSSPSYSSDALMARAFLGILLIAFGLLALLSIIAPMDGVVFSFVQQLVYGLGGSLAFIFPLFLIWAGALLALSARRKAPIRSIILSFLLYMFLLAFILLITLYPDNVDNKTYPLMDYIGKYNARSLIINPRGFINYLKGSYTLCSATHQGGGFLGMVIAWPISSLIGRVGGIILMPILMVITAFFLAQLDINAIIYNIKNRGHFSSLTAEEAAFQQSQDLQWQEEEAQKYMAMEQYHKQQTFTQQQQLNQMPPPQFANSSPEEDFYQKPGFSLSNITRLFKKDPPLTTAMNQEQPFTPPQQNNSANPSLHNAYRRPSPSKNVELYDEIIAPVDFVEVEPNQQDLNFSVPSFKRRTTEDSPSPSSDLPVSPPSFDPEILPTSFAQRNSSTDSIKKSAPPFVEPVQPPASLEDPQPIEPVKKEVRGLSYFPATSPTGKMSGEDLGAPKIELPEGLRKKTPEKEKQQVAYAYPSFDMLHLPSQNTADTSLEDQTRADTLEETLQSFGIDARVKNITRGPAITRFELELAAGVNVKRITSISDNIALSMASNGVRIEAPIPGKSLVGIEVPNKEIQAVTLREVLQSNEMNQAKSPLSVSLGKDIAGKPIICDLARMPHLLIAGATGSGKSVCINSIINSIIYRSTPEEVRMILIDPKVVELQGYNGIPHLIVPVVSDPHKAAGALNWAVAEMMERYQKFTAKGVRNMAGYNNALDPGEEKLPFILVVIDELADLMMAAKKDVEESICRLAQLARAAGIHLIVATQRPSVDVITGLIKANIPSRIAFAVSSNIDSRTILDAVGAEKLLGRGDMLFSPSGARTPTRVQGCFVSDEEVNRITQFVRSHSQVEYDPTVLEHLEQEESTGPLSVDSTTDASDLDPLLKEAIEMAVTDGQTSISMLQRRLRIGYARSGRLIDEMTRRGIISQAAGAKPREVLISREDFEALDFDN